MAAPNRLVQEAFLAPAVEITRRVEIYNFDGTTPWREDLWPYVLVGGNVSVDMARDERRSVDVELDNTDGDLDPVAGGFWYDKVLKVFYGIVLDQKPRVPKVLIVEEYLSPGQGLALKTLLAQAGVTYVLHDPQVETYAEVEDYDVLISISSTYSRKLPLLTQAYQRGKSVITFGLDATPSQLPYIIATAGASPVADTGLRRFVKNASTLDTASTGWEDNWTLNPPHAYRRILSTAAGVVILASTTETTNGQSPAILLRAEQGGGVWAHVQQARFDAAAFDGWPSSFGDMVAALIRRCDTYVPQPMWEAQIGEFVPDNIEDADDMNDRIKFTGRDYTKRCLGSKLVKATTFTKDQKVEDVIRTLALNSKVFKINLPVTVKTLGKDMTWERDTDRWSIMKEVALANNYELYFNAEGYLSMREQQDPLVTPPSLTLTTGIGGNLVSRGARTGDSQLFNHVTVVGESSDTTVPLVFASAINTNPNSPSNVDAIGERTKNVSSALVTSEAQAQALANSLLSVSSLEEFELRFSSVLFPWVEPGEIVEMDDPDGTYWGPTRYLISSLGLPLDLSPMSGTAKRVTRV